MYYLIVKTSSIGDIIQTFPVVDYLHEKDPGCMIDWIVEEEYAPLLRSYPGLSSVLTVATRRWRHCLIEKKSFQELKQTLSCLRKHRYNVLFDLQGNTKSGLITQMASAQKKVGFGWSSISEWPNYFATRQRFEVGLDISIQRRYLSVVEQFFHEQTPFQPKKIELQLSAEDSAKLIELRRASRSRIMVAFASKWENKCLLLSTWLQFLGNLYQQENPIFYFVSGTAQEKQMADRLAAEFPESFSLQGLSFPLWQRLMGEMDLVIAVDSAALALCGTTSTPSFSFFGPTQASVYKPLGQHYHFQGECPYQVKFSARCPKLRTCPTGACLKEVGASTLIKTYQEAVKAQDGVRPHQLPLEL